MQQASYLHKSYYDSKSLEQLSYRTDKSLFLLAITDGHTLETRAVKNWTIVAPWWLGSITISGPENEQGLVRIKISDFSDFKIAIDFIPAKWTWKQKFDI